MRSYDVLIAGGGPAGSSCAWRLRGSGLSVAILDRETFPRDKICGGWITPGVLKELEIESSDYAAERTLQPITCFRTGSIGGPAITTAYDQPISYGIRRREFDEYLIRRCGATLHPGEPLGAIERAGDRWIVNHDLSVRLIVGAGGHFCPVARFFGTQTGREPAVVAQEVEFPMTAAQQSDCAVDPQTPELYFCEDMKGYGWCFRKENFLNIGLGRADHDELPKHVARFIEFLKSERRISFEIPPPHGHAYLLYGTSNRDLIHDGAMLIGDAAGLAYLQSGEGIRPAIESGLLAAETILSAEGDYTRDRLTSYRSMLETRLGSPKSWTTLAARYIPAAWVGATARHLLTTKWFTRHVVLDRWFLHQGEAELASSKRRSVTTDAVHA